MGDNLREIEHQFNKAGAVVLGWEDDQSQVNEQVDHYHEGHEHKERQEDSCATVVEGESKAKESV